MPSPLKKKKATITKKFQGKEINPILFKSFHTNHDVYFLTETKGIGEINYLIRHMQTLFPEVGFQVINTFGLNVKSSEISKNPTNFYIKNALDIRKYIPAHKKVITLGRALMGVTMDSDIKVEGFYDSNFQETHFYAPNLQCQVFPVDPGFKWYNAGQRRGLDNFYLKFLKDQIRRALKFVCVPRRTPLLGKFLVEDPVQWMRENWSKKVCAWDLETSSLDYQRGYIICLTITFNGLDGYYLRFKDLKDLELFDEFMANKFQVGANLKFDLKFMKWIYPFKNLKVDFDTMHAGHILNEMRSNSLKTHGWLYTTYGGYDLELELFKHQYKKMDSYADIPEPILREYATMDAIVTFQVYERMKEQLAREPTLNDYFWNIVMPFVRIFPDIELAGVTLAWDMVRKVGAEFTGIIKNIEKEMHQYFGEINFNGDEFALKLEALGWPEIDRDKKGFYKINKDTVKEWVELGLEGADLIAKRQKYVTAQGTFVGLEEQGKGFWKYMGVDEKLHPNFLVMMANSHRLRCNNPNLQNYPKHGAIAKLIRMCFAVPSDDFLISETDFDGLQLRIGAVLSEDPVMREIFMGHGDMHSLTGHAIFCNFPMKYIKWQFPDGSTDELLWDITPKSDDRHKLLKEGAVQIGEVHKVVELDDFLRFKKVSPFCKNARQKAKGANFGMLFGSTVYGVCFNVIMKDWKPSECFEFSLEMELNPTDSGSSLKTVFDTLQALKAEIESLKGATDEKSLKRLGKLEGDFTGLLKRNFQEIALLVAGFVHESFFGRYKRLQPWIEECHNEAKEMGYIRCLHGARRLLPQLTYIGKDSDKKEVGGWENIAVNSRVQNFEVAVVARAMTGIHVDFEKNKMQSFLFGMIHDAVNKYIHKDEMAEAYRIIKENMEKDYPEYNGISFTAEADIAYPVHPVEEKRTYWGSAPVWEGETFKDLFPELSNKEEVEAVAA